MVLKRRTWLDAIALSLVSAISVSSAALAQSSDTTTDTSTAASAKKPPPSTEVDELVVTGSRIRRTNFNTPAPVQIITTEDSRLEGLIDPASVLQHSSIAANSAQLNNQLSAFVENGGPGLSSISLRGL